MKYAVMLALLGALSTQTAWAQQTDPACQVANAVLGALFKGQSKVPCNQAAENNPSNASQSSQRGGTSSAVTAGGPLDALKNRATGTGTIDTEENLAAVMDGVRLRYSNPNMSAMTRGVLTPSEVCFGEMRGFGQYRNTPNSGWQELNAKCLDQATAIFNARDAETRSKEDEEKKAVAAEEAAFVAELRSGKRKAVNCNQLMVIKGIDPKKLNTKIMEVAYQPPKGLGFFYGTIERIEGDTLVLSTKLTGELGATLDFASQLAALGGNQAALPSHTIVIPEKDAQIYSGDLIRIGSIVRGYAVQAGTRNVRLVNGSTSTVAVMRATCMDPFSDGSSSALQNTPPVGEEVAKPSRQRQKDPKKTTPKQQTESASFGEIKI